MKTIGLVKKDYAFLKYPEIEDVCIEYGITDEVVISAMYEVVDRLHKKIYLEAEDYYSHQYED